MMKTGFAREKITPWNGVHISGYYETRTVKGVLDDLYVSAAAFDDGEKKAVIVTADVLMLSKEQCNAHKAEISRRTGIAPEAIFINCSHTHTGPFLNGERFGDEVVDEKYCAHFAKALEDTATNAFLDMKESKLSVGEGEAKNISFVRRYKMKDGSTATNPGVGNPNIDQVLGDVNETVKFLRIDREGGDDIVLVSFGTHADTVGGEHVSADWPGFVRSTLENALPNTKCLFLTASQGDVNHINPNPTYADRRGLEYDSFDNVPRGYDHAAHMGRVVASAVLAGYGKARFVNADKISFAEKEIEIPANAENDKLEESKKIKALHMAGRAHELPFEKMELTTVVAEAYRIVELSNGPNSFFFTLSALSIGDVVFLGMPGECFTEIGRRIEAESPFATTFVCCLTNGGETYFPTASAYDEGGYEARSSRLKKGGDNIVVSNMVELSNSMK
ncbi:MAG: hypothetical protein J6B48_06820 [Clostridia bacterium]|nr:hypothetical protein [Clostridia bacterium]